MSDDAVFPDFVKDLLTAEDQRRANLEARGSTVIGASATLVTLLVALVAFAAGKKDFTLPSGTHVPLACAAGAFIVAALLAVGVYAPQRVRIVDPAALRELLPEYWPKGADFARKKVTATLLDELEAAQRVNDWKARALLSAVIAQLTAVTVLTWAVLEML